jgi:hypothetical protein
MAAMPAWAFEFSAERTLQERGKVTAAKVNAREDRWRFEYKEPQDSAQVCIVRRDQHFAWLILSPLWAFVEVPIRGDHMLLVDETMEGEIARDLIGTEVVNGYPTQVFKVTVEKGGERLIFYQWVTVTERFAIRTVSKNGDWLLEYSNVKFAPQYWRYFEPPRGYAPKILAPHSLGMGQGHERS